ncbi:hypothetical protein CWRG_02467 [Chthonomonas calidirosea]|uniref:hypothetical protein n=1 Tax=Chthonomonas calidirosea TaxID=454171 RepID=UPI0006DD3E5E|nr:hypothetical protein [Chthonomonas calidirosea]CEK19326.1 hypothetical protein CWRG_02467 [Chthonomonas calidirosea]
MPTDTQPVSIRLDKQVIENLKRVARYESFKRDQDVTYADLIRETIVHTYPMPKDEDADTDQDRSA